MGRYFFAEVGKDGTNGKATEENSSELSKQPTPEDRGFNSAGTKSVNPVKTQALQHAPTRYCGDCGRFHTPDCKHPMLAMDGDPQLIKADSGWACECKGWTFK